MDKLVGDPFNPKPKTSTSGGDRDVPLDIKLGRVVTFNPNVNVDETPEGRVQEAAPPKRWYVTETLVKEHGRTMGCSRCTDATGIHNAECRRRIEGILLRKEPYET